MSIPALNYNSSFPYDSFIRYDGTILWQCPVVYDNPPFLPDTCGVALSLFRHYTPRARGVNVFMLSNGTFVQDTATPENSNVNVPYPWDPYNPAAPFSRVVQYPPHPEIDTGQNPYIIGVFYGGHIYNLDGPMASALFNAGYGSGFF